MNIAGGIEINPKAILPNGMQLYALRSIAYVGAVIQSTKN